MEKYSNHQRLVLRYPKPHVITAVLLVLLLWFCFLCVRDYRAQAWMASGNLGGIERSASIEPRNAEAWAVQGHTRLFALLDSETAAAELQRAIALNPHDSRYWIDLSAAQRLLGDGVGQRQSMARALAADPTTPSIAWEAANVALADGDVVNALRRFRTVILYDPDRAGTALDLCWRATSDLPLILKEAVPATPAGYTAMLGVMLRHGQLDGIAEVWSSAQAQHVRVPADISDVAVNALIGSGRSQDAARIWRELGAQDQAQAYRAYVPSAANLMVNPGFELELINTGFDWRIVPSSAGGVKFTVDSQAHSGDHSLRLDFATAPAENPVTGAELSQYIAIEPGKSYRVGMYAKSEGLVSASKPQLLVEDAESGAPLLRLPEVENVSYWKEYSGNFTVPASTHLLRLRLARANPAALIHGRLWLDEFSLREARPQ